MEFIKKRQNDPQYLKSVIAQRDIIIDQEKRKFDQVTKQNAKLKSQNEEIQRHKLIKEEAAGKQIANLNAAIQHLETQVDILKQQKNEVEFMLNNSKIKLQEVERQHSDELERLKIDFDGQKELLNSKIINLEKNLADLRKYYKVEESIVEDKKKIIEDSNRDLRGFSNQKQERLLIIQNQQFKNEIEYQSKNITVQLDKNEKLQQQIKSLKLDLELHKEIQNDLVKRSSLAQTLIKKLYKQIQELKKQSGHLNTQAPSQLAQSQRDRFVSRQSQLSDLDKQKDEMINKLKFEIANLKNEKHYMESIQKISSRKYQTLASILAQYLENILYGKDSSSEGEIEGAKKDQVLNIQDLKGKDIKQWSINQMEIIIQLLLTQIKPFLSKSSLVNFPEVKNINVSFVEETPKEVLSLPKISQNYEKAYEKQAKKGQNRFKDIPIDISTKILRSNLREWGAKVKFGNMPINKVKSRSIIEQSKKSFL